MRICLTTTSYQDTPGKHHELLEKSGFDVIRARGPLTEDELLSLIDEHDGFDGFLHGDDHFTRKVIEKALPKTKVLAKYGIGLDSVDVAAATEHKLPVLFTPGVNHTTVAEHTIGLMITLAKHLAAEVNYVNTGQWKRITGHELAGKILGVIGMGRIGKEVIKRGHAFDMTPIAFDPYWDEAFATEYDVEKCASAEEVLQKADVISLHMNLTDDNRHFVNASSIANMKDGAYLINCSRGGLIDEQAVANACSAGELGGYAADVLEEEPMKPGHPFQAIENIVITPHIGSRTFESVERQAVRATLNIVNFLNGDSDFIQANKF